ncbi:LGFP repeat-containing protein [Corynebacterium pacaense]|uniref:LGFP repeat-containing protein n=1 Tax=Corynebacterium pacaense TaxID=1816684 RepID=UPI0009BB8BF8|nr:hypothetical protein [Corynebacterium pacaense]
MIASVHYERPTKKRNAFTGAIIATVLIATMVATPVAYADVFHGKWIRGAIAETYLRLGGHSAWGDAISDETPGARGGLNQHFQNDASIFWNADVSGGVARQVGGLIRSKWEEKDWERGYLGYPTTDETALPNRTGRFNHFEGGSIYWSPETGAHPVSGAIKEYWSTQGWENSPLGLPTSDPGLDVLDATGVQHFENGDVRVGLRSLTPLPVSDKKPHSSYRVVVPIFPVDFSAGSKTAHLGPEGLNQHVKRAFSTLFPYSSCPTRITVGSTCELTAMGGLQETVKVSTIADDGFALTTTAGSPEGAGRTTTFTFTLVSSRSTDADLVFPNSASQILFGTSEPTTSWVSLSVESFGPIATAQWSGPFNNRRIGAASWAKMGGNILSATDNMKTVYLVEGIEEDSLAGVSASPFEEQLSPTMTSFEERTSPVPSELLPLEECAVAGCEVE